jgi:asparagine synthase (glutamine-hydrolysing)
MCGMAGLLGVPPELATPAAARMLAALRHRGPDGGGVDVVPDPNGQAHPAVLVHTRLAIRDLSPAGRQPMADESGNRRPNWIVYNGEVFNFLDLHGELAQADWPCRTRCDTEVILHAYRVWGEAAVERFRGMFAWCLLDAGRGTAWFCRDRLGIKPLYLYRPSGGGLLFASEVRTLLAAGPTLVPPHVSASALEGYLAQGAVYGAGAIVTGVELLEPAHSLVTDWSGRSVRSAAYWRLPFGRIETAAPPTDRARAVAALHDTLREAVALRLTADVPVGLFLSGGVDSAAVATIATEVNGPQVQTVSIGFDQPQFDETEQAARVARELGTEHRTLRLTGSDVLDDLPDVLAAVDQPTVDGFNTYFVARQARRAGLTVALSGVGGDELFGGYASFRDVPRAVRWRRRLTPVRSAVRPAARLLAAMLGRGTAKAATLLDRPTCPLHAYLLRRELFLPADRRSLHRLPFGCEPNNGLQSALADDMLRHSGALDSFNQVSLFELSGYLRHMLLRDADVFSMAHALEVRVPLLDHRLVEQVAALPGKWKRANGRPKPLLLDAVGPRLPAHAYTAPKRGFTFPWDAWLRGPLRERARQALEDGDIWSQLGVDPSGPRHVWGRFERSDRRLSALQVLGLVVLADYTARHGLRWVT